MSEKANEKNDSHKAIYQVFQFNDGSYFAGADQTGVKTTSNIIYAEPVIANSPLYEDYFRGKLVTVRLEVEAEK